MALRPLVQGLPLIFAVTANAAELASGVESTCEQPTEVESEQKKLDDTPTARSVAACGQLMESELNRWEPVYALAMKGNQEAAHRSVQQLDKLHWSISNCLSSMDTGEIPVEQDFLGLVRARIVQLCSAPALRIQGASRVEDCVYFAAQPSEAVTISRLSEAWLQEDRQAQLFAILQHHPESDWRGAAATRLGEARVDQPADAWILGNLGARAPDVQLRAQAEHDLAIVEAGAGHADHSVALLKSAINLYSETQLTPTGTQLSSRRESAQNLLMGLYLEEGRQEEAIRFALSGEPPNNLVMENWLVERVASQGDPRGSVALINRLLENEPCHPIRPHWTWKVVQLSGQMGEADGLDILRQLATKLPASGSCPEQGAESTRLAAQWAMLAQARSAYRTGEGSLEERKSEWSRRTAGQDLPSSLFPGPAHHKALALYSILQSTDPPAGIAMDAHREAGDLLFNVIGDWPAAASEYAASISQDASGLSTEYSARAWVRVTRMVWEKELDGSSTKEVAAEGYLHALDHLSSVFPADPQGWDASAEGIRLRLFLGDHEEAERQTWLLVARAPHSESSARAVNDLQSTMGESGDYSGVRQTLRRAFSVPNLGSDGLIRDWHQDDYDAARAITFAACAHIVSESRKGPGDDDSCIKALSDHLAEFPDVREAPATLAALIDIQESMGNRSASILLRRELLGRFPRSPQATSGLLDLCFFEHEDLMDFEGAIACFEEVRKRDPKHPAARTAAYHEAARSLDLGRFEEALNCWRAWLEFGRDPRGLPAPSDEEGVGLRLAKALIDAGRPRDAGEVLGAERDILGPTMSVERQLELAWAESVAFTAQGRVAEAVLAREGAYQLVQDGTPELMAGTPTGRALAQVYLLELDDARRRFSALPMAHPPIGATPWFQNRWLVYQIERKGQAWREVEAWAIRITKLKSAEESADAMLSLAGACEELGTALKEAPIPSYLSPEQAEIQREELEDRALIQEERAIFIYETVLSDAATLGVPLRASRAAWVRLQSLRPDRYPPAAEDLPSAPSWQVEVGNTQIPGYESSP